MMMWWNDFRIRYGTQSMIRSALRSLSNSRSTACIEKIGLWNSAITRKLGDGGQAVRKAYQNTAQQRPELLVQLIRNYNPHESFCEPYELARALISVNADQTVTELLNDQNLKRRDVISSAIRAVKAQNRFLNVYQEWIHSKDRDLREEAVRVLAATQPVLIENIMNSDPAAYVRFTAAKALKEVNWIPPNPFAAASQAVAMGGQDEIIASGAYAIPALMSKLTTKDDTVPTMLENIRLILEKEGKNVPISELELLSKLAPVEYYSREFGSGHADAGYGFANTDKIKKLAQKLLAGNS